MAYQIIIYWKAQLKKNIANLVSHVWDKENSPYILSVNYFTNSYRHNEEPILKPVFILLNSKLYENSTILISAKHR
jgi:hypothetical protein